MPTHRVIVGDCRDALAGLPERSAHVCVTSPPYWGLRDYGTGQWEGGDAACDHIDQPMSNAKNRLSLGHSDDIRDKIGTTPPHTERATVQYRDRCAKCGAVRVDHQLGLEPRPDCLAWAKGEPPCGSCYVCNLRAVFACVWRVLRDDGTCWVVLGDSYATSAAGKTKDDPFRASTLSGGLTTPRVANSASRAVPKATPPGLKPKDLVMVPERFRLAMQADGWYVRSVIRWCKKSCMPESVTDRPTSAVEDVVLLAKSARYFWDSEAVREDWADDRGGRPGGRKPAERNYGGRTDGYTKPAGDWEPPADRTGRNPRNYLVLGPEPLKDAHYAAYPSAIPRFAVSAGTSEHGCCPACGAGWVRVVSRNAEQPNVPDSEIDRYGTGQAGVHRKVGGRYQKWLDANPVQTLGWQPSCACPDSGPPVPCTVLDPFSGSGTTGVVAARLGRSYVGVELNPEYARMSLGRIEREGAPLFGAVVAEAPARDDRPAQAALFAADD